MLEHAKKVLKIESEALCDGPNMVTITEMSYIMEQVVTIDDALRG